MPKTGRPIIGKKKDISIRFCVDCDINKKIIDYSSINNNISKAEVIRIALEKFFEN